MPRSAVIRVSTGLPALVLPSNWRMGMLASAVAAVGRLGSTMGLRDMLCIFVSAFGPFDSISAPSELELLYLALCGDSKSANTRQNSPPQAAKKLLQYQTP